MVKCRITKRTNVDGEVRYVIQQRHWLFRWIWADAWENNFNPHIRDTFYTLKEAKKNLCYFDGSKPTEQVVFEGIV